MRSPVCILREQFVRSYLLFKDIARLLKPRPDLFRDPTLNRSSSSPAGDAGDPLPHSTMIHTCPPCHGGRAGSVFSTAKSESSDIGDPRNWLCCSPSYLCLPPAKPPTVYFLYPLAWMVAPYCPAATVKPKPSIELWGVGDLAMATPFLQAASRGFNVTLLAKSFAEELRNYYWPEVRVLLCQAPWTAFRGKYRLYCWPWREMWRLVRNLRLETFDFGVSARQDPRDHLLLRLVDSKQRLGFPRSGSQYLLTQPLMPPAPPAHVTNTGAC
jgi:hypothetical protein